MFLILIKKGEYIMEILRKIFEKRLDMRKQLERKDFLI